MIPLQRTNPAPRLHRTTCMRKHATVLALIGAISVLSACGSSEAEPSTSAAAKGTTVTTKLLAFEPAELTVKAGTTVVWKVSDSVGHTVTTGTFELGGDGLRTSENPDGRIDKPIGAGKEASYTFTEPGTYTYYCSIHKGMSGEVTVTE